jgi:integrase
MQSNVKPKALRKSNKKRRLPNGFGQISEIKNRNLRNPFRAMISVGKEPNGRPICKPLKPESYFETYNDAYSALVEYHKNPYDIDAGITCRELYVRWSDKHFPTLSASGSRANKNAWAYCSAISNMPFAEIRQRHIKGCMEEGIAVVRGREVKPTALIKNNIKSLWNMMFDYALEYELVSQNYSRSFNLSDEVIQEVKTVKKGHIPFSDEEMDLLWTHKDDKFYVDVLLIQCYSGWRPQELCLLEIANVDIKKWIFTGGMKTDAGFDRAVPIHSKIRPLVMEKYKEAKSLNSKYLFNRPNSQNFTYDFYAKEFSKIKTELKLNPDHKPHDGRKHFVTNAKKFYVDEYAIKYMVGHKISDITEKVYTQREFEWLKEEIEKIK